MSRRRGTRVRSWTTPGCSGWWTERHAVSAPGVQCVGDAIDSAPDDHFAASPHYRMQPSLRRRACRAGTHPTIEIGIVSAAAIEQIGVVPTPDDHVASGPNCRVRRSGIRRIGSAGGCPAVRAGIVSSASVQSDKIFIFSAPRQSCCFRSRLPCDVIGHQAHWQCW
jgi:hypothetical protein